MEQSNRKAVDFGPIELQVAQKYFEDFETKGFNILFNKILGGVYTAAHFKNWVDDPNFVGIMFWYCYNKQTEGFLLAAEKKVIPFEYDEAEIENYLPTESGIILSTNILTETGINEWFPFQKEVDFSQDVLKPSIPDRIEDAETIIPLEFEFLDLTREKNLSKVSFAYMCKENVDEEGNSYLLEFLSDSRLVYLSYHFGYDPKVLPHGLRLVLIGRDVAGKPIKNTTGSLKFEIYNKSKPPRET